MPHTYCTKKSVCPKCMSWMLDHDDPKLRRDGWKMCRSCGFSKKNIKDNMQDKKDK